MHDETMEFRTESNEFGSRMVAFLMDEAVKRIDDKFGEGYAKNNPVLVGAYIQALSIQQVSAELGQGFAGSNSYNTYD